MKSNLGEENIKTNNSTKMEKLINFINSLSLHIVLNSAVYAAATQAFFLICLIHTRVVW